MMKRVLQLVLIFMPVVFMARTLVQAPEVDARGSVSPVDLGGEGAGFEILPVDPPGRAPAGQRDPEAFEAGPEAAIWDLPEKFLPTLRSQEWVTQSFQEQRQINGKTVKLTVLIDLRWVRGRGQLAGIQFRDPRFLVEGQTQSFALRGLQVIFNTRVLSEIEAYRELNLVASAGEMISIHHEAAYPLVLLPVAKEGNFMGIRLRGFTALPGDSEIKLAQNRGI